MVQADVVSLALELSPSLLVLSPTPMALATSEYRSCVTVRNRRNHAAEFSWRTVVTEKGNPFTVQPTTGSSRAAQSWGTLQRLGSCCNAPPPHSHSKSQCHFASSRLLACDHLHFLAVQTQAMFSALQAPWSHTVRWTVRSCGIPPSPPL